MCKGINCNRPELLFIFVDLLNISLKVNDDWYEVCRTCAKGFIVAGGSEAHCNGGWCSQFDDDDDDEYEDEDDGDDQDNDLDVACRLRGSLHPPLLRCRHKQGRHLFSSSPWWLWGKLSCEALKWILMARIDWFGWTQLKAKNKMIIFAKSAALLRSDFTPALPASVSSSPGRFAND